MHCRYALQWSESWRGGDCERDLYPRIFFLLFEILSVARGCGYDGTVKARLLADMEESISRASPPPAAPERKTMWTRRRPSAAATSWRGCLTLQRCRTS